EAARRGPSTASRRAAVLARRADPARRGRSHADGDPPGRSSGQSLIAGPGPSAGAPGRRRGSGTRLIPGEDAAARLIRWTKDGERVAGSIHPNLVLRTSYFWKGSPDDAPLPGVQPARTPAARTPFRADRVRPRPAPRTAAL